MERPRTLFLAGSTGAVGRTLLRRAHAAGVPIIAHARSKPGRPEADCSLPLDGSATDALAAVLTGCTTVIQCVGTMRKRFASGDTYETSDLQTTRALLDAALRANARQPGAVDHVILLSSVGAGRPMGAYLQAKARAEAMVVESGLSYTIWRPSAFYSASNGEGHVAPPSVAALMRWLGLYTYRPISVEALAAGMLQNARARHPLGVALEGRGLWQVVGEDE